MHKPHGGKRHPMSRGCGVRCADVLEAEVTLMNVSVRRERVHLGCRRMLFLKEGQL